MNLRKAMSLAVVLAAGAGFALAAPQAPPSAAADGRLSSPVFLEAGSIPIRLKPFEMQTVRLK